MLLIQADPQSDPSKLSSIVSLQALILMIIANANSGPSGLESNRWFGLALAIATSPKLQLHRPPQPREANDPFALPAQGRRAWLILSILDRWHAAATVVPLVIADGSASLLDSDMTLVGAPTYHLYRMYIPFNFLHHEPDRSNLGLSRILGHLTDCLMYSKPELATPPSKGGKLNAVLDGEIETFRESVKELFPTLPRLHLAYTFLRLLADRNLEVHISKTNSVVYGALQVVTLLNHKRGIYASPLLHYITSLTALTLVKAVDYPINPNTALAMQDFRSGLDNGNFRFNNAKPVWDTVVGGFIARKLDSPNPGFGHDGDRRGLEHLADAAVGKSEVNSGGEGGSKRTDAGSIDWSVETALGFLNLVK